jgi:hypothetical protein
MYLCMYHLFLPSSSALNLLTGHFITGFLASICHAFIFSSELQVQHIVVSIILLLT